MTYLAFIVLEEGFPKRLFLQRKFEAARLRVTLAQCDKKLFGWKGREMRWDQEAPLPFPHTYNKGIPPTVGEEVLCRRRERIRK